MPKAENSLQKIVNFEKQNILDSKLFERRKSKTILLKYHKSTSFIWKGLYNRISNVDEVPLILEFNQKLYYFYSSGIGKCKNKSKSCWINYRKSLDFSKQEKIIQAFTKVADQKNVLQQIVLLKLKNDFLDISLQFLNSKLNSN